MKRYFCCFFGILLLAVGAAWYVSATQRANFINDYDAGLLTKIEMARNLPPDTVAILGDSLAVCHFVPDHLGVPVAVLGLEQSSCIEAFRFTQILLAGAHPPRAVILSLNRWHITTEELEFFPVGSRVGLYDWRLLETMQARARRYQDPMAGPDSPLDIDFRLASALKLARFPSFYFPTVLRIVTDERTNANQRVREETLSAHGHKSGPDHDGDPHPIKFDEHFIPLPLQESYLVDLLTLLQERNIPVFFADGPVNDLTAITITQDYREEYARFLKSLQARFPNFHLLGEILPVRSWRDFADGIHLRPGAAALYSDHMGDLLRAALRDN